MVKKLFAGPELLGKPLATELGTWRSNNPDQKQLASRTLYHFRVHKCVRWVCQISFEFSMKHF